MVHTSYNINGTRVTHVEAMRVARACYMQLNALSITIMYRATLIFIFTCKVLFYTHMHLLAMICVISTCSSIGLPQPDQVMRAAAYQCFDYKHGL